MGSWRKDDTKPMVAVIEGCEDYYAEAYSDVRESRNTRWLAEEAVRHHKLTTSRSEPTAVDVVIYEVTAREGRLHRRPMAAYAIVPPTVPMTQDEYMAEFKSILEDVPDEFRMFIGGIAIEYGGESHECRLVTLRQLIAEFKPSLEKYDSPVV